jgi:type IV pilus assembly protein PilB
MEDTATNHRKKVTRSLLGEMLVEQKIITAEQLREALSKQEQTGKRLGDVLLEQGLIQPSQLISELNDQTELPSVDVERFPLDPEVLKVMDARTAREFCAVPIKQIESHLFVAMPYPFSEKSIQELGSRLNRVIRPMIALRSQLDAAITRHYTDANPLN